MTERTIVLSRRDVEGLLDLDTCIAAVQEAFRLQSEGRAGRAAMLGYPSPAGRGGFHVKAAALDLGRVYFAAKINGNFSGNPLERGLPAIQGIVALFDAADGSPLALMDSIEITTLRTAAATAVAARYLARPGSRVAAVCGCGRQGRAQLRALARVLPLERAFVFDVSSDAASRFARELGAELGIDIEEVAAPQQAVAGSDVCVTSTPSRRPYLARQDLPPGLFLAAVGSDAPDKQELDPAILASATVVVDSLEQCAEIGELHHALEAGVLQRSSVHAELADLVVRRRAGRAEDDEVTVFDSTGVALEDVAAAVAVYERALAAGSGNLLELGF